QVGTLVVVVLKAKNLPDKHVVSKQNPYTKITYDGQTLITAVDKRGGQHPVWDEELRFTVHVDAPTLAEDGSVITPGLPTSMDISLWANEGDHADLLGGTVIDVADTLKRGEFDEWIPLYRNDTQRGDVFLEMTYFSALPPSLGR
ncbi:C2 domain-containing protein, partial [Mucidula mucida]